ncbi:MAG: hypothetical protein A3K19_27730 [Lentisphaerae bacterium RIFOXYB12_FULL_65_16]|nr:MAG: hypothetical protein A3K19_27730 [Lentisphaerae bacterium RIFOXYB12_FULL_65_16]
MVRSVQRNGGGDGPQTVRAQKALVRLVQARRLGPGAQLPNQAQLRALLGFSNDSLSAAMNRLVELGFLQRRRRVGTTVADPGATPPGLWRIGILTSSPWEEFVSPFDSQLLHYLQAHIGRRLCVPCIYFHTPGLRPAVPGDRRPDFPGLTADLESGVVDGLMSRFSVDGESATEAWDPGVPVCYAGSWEEAPCGACIDYRELVVNGVELLAARGCRRIGLVSAAPPTAEFHRFWGGFTAAMKENGLSIRPDRPVCSGQGPQGGRQVAAQLLALSPRQRPDGLMVVDDRICTGLCAGLREASDYRPVIVTHANHQAPLDFALPVTRIEVDIDALADRAVSMLLARVLDPTLADERVYLPPLAVAVARKDRRICA